MTTPSSKQGALDRALEQAKAREPEPPLGFVATIMRRVQAIEAGRTAWRRWRRAARAANLSPSRRVDIARLGNGGFVMKKI
ncbi:MAG TPA: hypothetical protein VEL51_21035, partial [Vicinamibacterales bacterium]|nr:hypothetical protein [Vicinamibacterales bacterium]